MSAAHTPGTWLVNTSCDGEAFVTKRTGIRIAEVYYEPDAHLISAAPDLLAALNMMMDPHCDPANARAHAHAAIAKAEGRS